MNKSRLLNVGVIQQELSPDSKLNLERLPHLVDLVMLKPNIPDLVVGVEYLTDDNFPLDTTGSDMNVFREIAKKHKIYFLPGAFIEKSIESGKEIFYNTAPVFNPKGEMIGKYRKMAPWRPSEPSTPGESYLVFDIPEKDTKVGVQICYDINFPEISRNLTLMGSEVLIKVTMDPEELKIINSTYPITRALEKSSIRCFNEWRWNVKR